MSTPVEDYPLNRPTILCVDDEHNVLVTLRTQLLRHFPGYRVEIVESAEEALEVVEGLVSSGIDVPLVIADQIMPGIQGDELLIALHARYPQMLTVMLTGQASVEDVGNVVNRGNLYRFMAKPWDETDLTLTVTEALRRYQQDRQLAHKQAELERANRELAALNATLEQQVQERTRQFQQSEANLEKAQELAHLGNWEYDRATRQVYWSDELYRIHGLDSTQPIPIGEAATQYIHPDDHRKYQRDILAKVLQGEGFVTDLRIADQGGATRFVEARGEPRFDADHTLIGYRGTVQDITDRKQLELALQESQAKLSALLDSTLAGVMKFRFYSNGTLSYDYVSPHCETILGYTFGEWMTTLEIWRSHIHPDDWREVIAPVVERVLALRDEANYTMEYRFRDREGVFRWLLERCWVSWCEVQQCWDLTTVMLDISDRKQMELALKESQRRFMELSEASPANIYIIVRKSDGSFYFEHISRSIEAMHEIPPERFLENANIIRDCIHPEDLPGYDAAVQQSLETMQPFCHEWRIINPSGAIKWLQGSSCPKPRHNGDIAWYGTVIDITARKQAEAALHQLNEELEQRVAQRTQELARSERDLRTIFNNVYDAILIHDMDGTVLDVNDRALELHHATRQQLLAATIADLSAPDAPLDVIPLNIQRVQAGETLCLEWKHRRFDDQSTFDVEISLRSVILGDRSVFIAGIRDISDRKQYEAQLQRTNDDLLHATRLKDEFLATMSHELRTPLNAILGITESLQESVFGAMTAAQQRALDMVSRSGDHLLALINDILDVAKIEAGEITLDYRETEIAPLCESSLALIQPQAHKKGIQLDLQLSSPLPAVWMDERRIRQVLLNLLSNAVKFTPTGGQVTLTARYDAPDPEARSADAMPNRVLHLMVQDTGIGIASHQQERIFQPFVQLDSALNRHYGGTGLGLTLVKRIVELHGGQLHLTSQVDVGSCFTVSLPDGVRSAGVSEPILAAPSTTDPCSPGSELAPLILLAEDNDANCQTIASYLDAKGYRLLLARDGQEAIALARSAQPALIIMDIQMPGVNGLEAIEQIRATPTGQTVPIIALTALAMPHDRDRCLAAGADEYLSKPVKLKHLAATIQHLLSPQLFQQPV